MKTIYFDCPAGISGNMILGALIDAGLDVKAFKRQLSKLPIVSAQNLARHSRVSAPHATRLHVSRVTKLGLAATYVEVDAVRAGGRLPLHIHRNLHDIKRLITSSRLTPHVKKNAIAIFTRLAKAEAKVHGTSIDKIHFHEVGAVDSIIDIVGACIALEMLGIEKVYCSPLPLGSGKVKCAHGILPLPAPATVELLKGFPVYGVDVKTETVTPTGAAIVTTLAESFGKIPEMDLISTGLGAGWHNTKLPNVLRVYIGEPCKDALPRVSPCILLETNIDDMSPQLYENAFGKLLKAGALDVWLDSIVMKRSRPGVKLSVLCKKDDIGRISDIIMKETTSIGIRIREIDRITADRKIKTVKTKYGNIRIKEASINGVVVNTMPEYGDAKKMAKKYKVPLKTILADAGVGMVGAQNFARLHTKRGVL